MIFSAMVLESLYNLIPCPIHFMTNLQKEASMNEKESRAQSRALKCLNLATFPLVAYIGGIAPGITDETLTTFLHSIVSPPGLRSWRRVADALGQPRSFGFAEFSDAPSLLKVSRLLQGSDGIVLLRERLYMKIDERTRNALQVYQEELGKEVEGLGEYLISEDKAAMDRLSMVLAERGLTVSLEKLQQKKEEVVKKSKEAAPVQPNYDDRYEEELYERELRRWEKEEQQLLKTVKPQADLFWTKFDDTSMETIRKTMCYLPARLKTRARGFSDAPVILFYSRRQEWRAWRQSQTKTQPDSNEEENDEMLLDEERLAALEGFRRECQGVLTQPGNRAERLQRLASLIPFSMRHLGVLVPLPWLRWAASDRRWHTLTDDIFLARLDEKSRTRGIDFMTTLRRLISPNPRNLLDLVIHELKSFTRNDHLFLIKLYRRLVLEALAEAWQIYDERQIY